jgi:Fic family protein
MNSLSRLKYLETIPISTNWLLNSIEEFKGKQELYTKQSPQKLEALKRHALIESSISSNRIEGVEIDRDRIDNVIFGKSPLKDRNEEEVRGYQKALKYIHEKYSRIEINSDSILKIHKLCKGDIWDSGRFKEKQIDITEIDISGRSRIRFKPPGPKESIPLLNELNSIYSELTLEETIPNLLISILYNLDFLCIHPFRDGNGRVSRLLLLLTLYRYNYEVGRYVSLEKIIEENKERYYESLEISSKNWEKGKNDFWPYINFILFVIKESYKTLDERIANLPNSKGNKSDLIYKFVENSITSFSVSEIKYNVPGVSIDLIRKVLKDLKKDGKIKNLSLGRDSRWEKK